jgi:hypothetical protein
MTKKIVIFLLFLPFLYSQTNDESKLTINFQNNFGYTMVNVSEAMEIPEYSEITQEGLVDWGQFNYKGLVQVFIPRDKFLIGGEVGFNRLYRWEERYKTFDGYDRWRWGQIWTWHIGVLLQLTIADQYYITSGAGVYTFLNGSGTTIGFPLAIGHDLKLGDKLTFPIEFRTDIIFGNATPIALGGGIGVRIAL